MRKIILVFLSLSLFSLAVLAQSYNSGSDTCMSLEEQKKDCLTHGGKVIEGTDFSNGCEYIRCRDQNYDQSTYNSHETTTSSNYYSNDYCGNGMCSSPETPQSCPQDCTPSDPSKCESIEVQKEQCVSNSGVVVEGMDYDGQGCPHIRCRSGYDDGGAVEGGFGYDDGGDDEKNNVERKECASVYKTEEEVEEEEKNCEAQGGKFEKWEVEAGCYETYCRKSASIECSWIEGEEERCKLNGGVPRKVKTGMYESVCPMIVCDYPESVAYPSEEACEAATGCFCEYKKCDMVPEGKSYEEFCGKNFKPGFYCMMKKVSVDEIKCGGRKNLMCPLGYHCEGAESWDEPGKCVKDNYPTVCANERVEEVEREKIECEKLGGKLVKQKDKWSNCEFYVCVSEEKCGSGRYGSVNCAEGYYCEVPRNSVSNSYSTYEGVFGKCVKIPEKKTESNCPELSEKTIEEQKNKCVVEYKGNFEVKTDANGCTYTDCVVSKPVEEECIIEEEVKKLLKKCIQKNGNPKVKSKQSCVKEVACTLEEKPVEKDEKILEQELFSDEKKYQELGKLFKTVFKLEELRVQFDKLKRRTLSIAKYYEEQGDVNYAKKFNTASNLLTEAIKELDSVKAELRDKIDKEEIGEETFETVKESLRKIKNTMKKILKELLR